MAKIKVGISSCLVGEPVRFDSGHKRNIYVTNVLHDYFEFVPFCPEVSIGLGIPRQTIRLSLQDDEVRCIGSKDPALDVTEKLYQSAEDQKHWHDELCGYILKKDSPSCGMERVRLYKGDTPDRVGVGLYAKRLMENFPNLPVEEEGRLGDPVLRENFIQRVFVYYRWRQMMLEPLTLDKLMQFHARHKFIFVSHDQNLASELGRWLSEQGKESLAAVSQAYLTKMMTLLKVRATRQNHANTLTHIQGFLKKHVTGLDKQELVETINNYRLGLLPLIVPLTLLRHHFLHHPNDYIDGSYYMRPHPSELMLLNQL
ncbi:YbgA family protein [Corallincola spongiicola]|uniref:DUF1722 domain-containing protein n=1 Tax=Corallincola spongiicola TaxID=2520508 RepID=A0ABY1WUU0_9GAMM|nr:DUF523 and DUF1722 domain-containing protein [Corallincola spongiicola]TAA48346.1 DUF1722 domain-containing protein [Corallincola spongiicola]